MKSLKNYADQLASLGKNIDHEDLIDQVLFGLDDAYKSIKESIEARDTPISFEELHVKLINKELSIKQNYIAPNPPATAFVAQTAPNRTCFRHSSSINRNKNGPGLLPTPPSSHKTPHPYLGKCQWFREQGHG